MAITNHIPSAAEARRTAGAALTSMTGAVKDVANEATTRLPEAVEATKGVLIEAGQIIRTGSNERLAAGTLLSFSFALGLLIAGANRLLVLLALIPLAAMGLTLLDRQATLHARTTSNGR